MTRRLPPLPWLRAFEAAARHLSFTHAAQELNLTQAAISKQVKLLEHFVREPLFQRLPRSLVLTKVGAAYLPKVHDAFDRLQAGTEEVFGGRRSEVLTVRSAVGFSVSWIAPRLPNFYAAHPKANVRIVSSVWSDTFDKERFDLDIQYGLDKFPGFKTDRLTWEFLEPLCSRDVAERLNTPDDLAGERLAHIIGYMEGWADWLSAAGATKVNAGQGIQFDTTLLALSFAATGACVALGRSSMSQYEIELGRLVRPFALRVPIKEAFHLIRPDDDSNEHPDLDAFRSWILDEAQAARDPDYPAA